MRKGFSLVELMVGISLLLIIFLGLYAAFSLSLKVVGQSKARVTALAIANAKIEEIRNLDYDDIGTEGGIPSGSLEEKEEVFRNGINFQIKTTVLYIDDPYDGLAPEDAVPTDYKRVRVKVSWQGFFGGEIQAVTNVAPPGIETDSDGGILKIIVFDANGRAVPYADVNIRNTKVTPEINANYETDIAGDLVIAGAPTSTEGYRISVRSRRVAVVHIDGLSAVRNLGNLDPEGG